MAKLQMHPTRLKLVLSDNTAPIIKCLDSGCARNAMRVLIRLTAPIQKAEQAHKDYIRASKE